MPKKATRPIYLSEFGGYCYAVKGHLFDEKRSYGYRSFSDLDSFKHAFVELYNNEIIPAVKEGLCASIYTQVSDVEEEINGILTYDRRVVKLSPKDTLPIDEALKIK